MGKSEEQSMKTGDRLLFTPSSMKSEGEDQAAVMCRLQKNVNRHRSAQVKALALRGEIRAISYKSSLLYLEQGATHLALAVYTWHRFQGAHWVLEAVESICTEKAP